MNEYCPAGQNIPLVRSREGQLVCVGCNSACLGQSAPAGQPGSASITAPESAAAAAPAAPAAPSAPAPVRDRALPVAAPEPEVARPASYRTTDGAAVSSYGGYGPGGASSAAAARPYPAATSGLPGRIALEAPMVTFQTPALRFSCTRLASGHGVRPRLLGDSLACKARLGLPGGAEQAMPDAELREAVRIQRDKLDEKVLLPSALARSDEARHVAVTCQDGSRFVVPERDCVLLPGATITLESIAAYLLEEVLGSPAAEGLYGAGAAWAEVTILDGAGAETTIRSAMPARAPRPTGGALS